MTIFLNAFYSTKTPIIKQNNHLQNLSPSPSAPTPLIKRKKNSLSSCSAEADYFLLFRFLFVFVLFLALLSYFQISIMHTFLGSADKERAARKMCHIITLLFRVDISSIPACPCQY